mmetsp:Transcript_22955/g.49669  ORF Transcript_22955/g.49669 Transcript_22955/m.49669 type:complete len:217 (+) Transcript_22955:2018-2668(+)
MAELSYRHLSSIPRGGFPLINPMSSLTSASNNRAALMRFVKQTSLVTFGVTFGFPSRSPPIQLANLNGLAVNGNPYSPPMVDFISASSLRKKLGNTSHNTVSMTSVPRSASSCGEGLTRDTSSVCQMEAISRRRSSSRSWRWYGVPLSRMLSASFRIFWTRPCFSRRVRRLTWVGWAVRTSSTVWVTRDWNSSSLDAFLSFKNWERTPAVESRLVS